jgi:hypothetical protein
MKIGRSRHDGQSVVCPRAYRGLEGCGVRLRYVRTTDNGLIECPNCGLWFAPGNATECRDVKELHAA